MSSCILSCDSLVGWVTSHKRYPIFALLLDFIPFPILLQYPFYLQSCYSYGFSPLQLRFFPSGLSIIVIHTLPGRPILFKYCWCFILLSRFLSTAATFLPYSDDFFLLAYSYDFYILSTLTPVSQDPLCITRHYHSQHHLTLSPFSPAYSYDFYIINLLTAVAQGAFCITHLTIPSIILPCLPFHLLTATTFFRILHPAHVCGFSLKRNRSHCSRVMHRWYLRYIAPALCHCLFFPLAPSSHIQSLLATLVEFLAFMLP